MFLDDYKNTKEKNEFLDDVKNKINNIQAERKEIGKIIEKELLENKSKKEIVELVIENTTLSRYSLNNMIDEYSFNTLYQTKLNISEIKVVKYYFKKEKFTEKEKKEFFLDSGKLRKVLEDSGTNEDSKSYKHTFSLKEEGEVLYENAIDIMETIIERKMRNKSEFFYFLLVEFIENNIELLEK